jgi:hypothetical protein
VMRSVYQGAPLFPPTLDNKPPGSVSDLLVGTRWPSIAYRMPMPVHGTNVGVEPRTGGGSIIAPMAKGMPGDVAESRRGHHVPRSERCELR